MARETVTIDLEDEIDRWEWRCPRGHTQWEPTNHHWWCARCATAYDADGVFYHLRSAKTGEQLERDDAILLTDTGPMKPRRAAAD